jgi:hypothetical protein
VRLDPRWSFGGSAENLNGAAMKDGRPVGRTLSAGLLFEPVPGWRLSAEALEQACFAPEWRFGTEAAIGSSCVVRGGCSRRPSIIAFGAGLRRGAVETDYACTIHPVLGATHRMDIVVRPRAAR